MGLTNSSLGINAVDNGLIIKKQSPDDKVVALAGNPNVGKSTVFNALTGLNQHTGNWPGKTVTNAQGFCSTEKCSYVMVDIPGTYSLMAHSAEEEVARNFICFGQPDAVVVVCDATCLERNLNLVLQTMEISSSVIVCVNLMDEAKRKNIKINHNILAEKLQVPVVSTIARKKKTLDNLLTVLDDTVLLPAKNQPYKITYSAEIEKAISMVEDTVRKKLDKNINTRWLSLKLIENDESLTHELDLYLGSEFLECPEIQNAVNAAHNYLRIKEIDSVKFKDEVVSSIVTAAEEIAGSAVKYKHEKYSNFDRKADKLLTSRIVGYPAMIAMLALVFWITISGANYPSALLSKFLFAIQDKLTELFVQLNAPKWLHGVLVLGMYRVLAWVVAVMLPPMAIFFPLFTILEDAGYLPRIAYNLDKPFKKCCACGKQALTMR